MNRSGIIFLELLIAFTILLAILPAITQTFWTAHKSLISMQSKLRTPSELRYVVSILKEDSLSTTQILSTATNHLSFINLEGDTITYSLNKSRLGRQKNGGRRSYLNEATPISQFTVTLKNGLEWTLDTKSFFFHTPNRQ